MDDINYNLLSNLHGQDACEVLWDYCLEHNIIMCSYRIIPGHTVSAYARQHFSFRKAAMGMYSMSSGPHSRVDGLHGYCSLSSKTWKSGWFYGR